MRDALKVAGKSGNAERNLLLFNIGINAGLKIGDIVKLRIEEVSGLSSSVIKEGKTRKSRTGHLSTIMEDIADYLAKLPATGFYFRREKEAAASRLPRHTEL